MYFRIFLFLIVTFSLFTVAACSRAEHKTSADAKRYELTGKIIAVDKQKHKATIQHNEIPGYMAAMTMDFPIKDEWVVRELEPEDKIAADLVVQKTGEYLLESVQIMKATRDSTTNAAVPLTTSGEEKIGQEVPNFTLINQDSKKISFNDFRGKVLILTFIFTRCPQADFCPRMSGKFADLEAELRKNPALAANVRLLSITIDPKFDTPQILKTYGAAYQGKDVKTNFDIWQLATAGGEKETKDIASFFGLQATPDGTQIIHNLRTAIISPDGKVYKIYAGSDWSNAELMRELQSLQTQ